LFRAAQKDNRKDGPMHEMIIRGETIGWDSGCEAEASQPTVPMHSAARIGHSGLLATQYTAAASPRGMYHPSAALTRWRFAAFAL
jgi:hypothetical protein